MMAKLNALKNGRGETVVASFHTGDSPAINFAARFISAYSRGRLAGLKWRLAEPGSQSPTDYIRDHKLVDLFELYLKGRLIAISSAALAR